MTISQHPSGRWLIRVAEAMAAVADGSRSRAVPQSSGGLGTADLSVHDAHHGGLRLRSRSRIGITDGCDADREARTGPCPAVAVARTTTATSLFSYRGWSYNHQSFGCAVMAPRSTFTDAAGAELAVVSADAAVTPTSPKNSPAKTASASRLARVAIKMTPFAWLGTSNVPTNLSEGAWPPPCHP